MLKKALATLAMAMLMISAACNTVTGPAVDDSTAGRGGNDTPRQPQERNDKVCLDDLRAAEIMTPVEGQILHNNDAVLVTFTVDHFCSGYTAAVEVSTDGGQSFQKIAEGRGLASALWKLPNLDDLRPVVRVRAWDSIGSVIADRATEFVYREGQPGRRGEQRD